MKALTVLGLMLGLAAGSCSVVSAQTWDNSGNGLLKGAYNFREVIWLVGDGSGNLGRALAVYGTVTYDGNGNYSMSARAFDSDAGAAQTFSTTGTYTISASGYGSMDHPISTGDSIVGLVSNGIFVGSSTEGGFNNLFIAAPAAAAASTNASFQGTYAMVGVDFPTGYIEDTRDSSFTLNADGNGNIGAIQVTGYIGHNGATAVSQAISRATYSFSGGAQTLSLGGTLSNSNLIAGNKLMFVSADGNFVFGGAPDGFDMIVGVKTPATAPAFSGLYYSAGVIQDEASLATSSSANLDTYYGSLSAGGNAVLQHQRILSVFANSPYDSTFKTNLTLGSDGTYDDPDFHYVFGNGGAIRLGSGRGPSIGIDVALRAPAFPAPSTPYIFPTGILNAASSALFTSGVAAGELITIYGANLSSTTAVDPAFPTTLANVRVLVNNRPAPIYVVSAGQISAVVPFGTVESIASIQVINNGTASNTVTTYVNLTAPGVFTSPSGGIGTAAALHPTYSVVTSQNPATAGEVVALYVTGLGEVSPAVSDGTPGPASPPSLTTNSFTVNIGGKPATVAYEGLAPGLVGLYQINVTVPTGLPSGDALVYIAGPDFITAQATLPIQ